jgi:hypothetical protein
MKKLLIVIVVLIVIIVVAAWLNSRRKTTVNANMPFKGKQKGERSAKVDVILSGQSKLLSYSIVLKNVGNDLESVFFRRDGQDVFRASGPRSMAEEGEEVVVHGMWQEKSRVPITDRDIEALKTGQMEAVAYFKDTSIEPYVIQLAGK